jgi:ABC-type sugar transport system substrate-binding protein
MARPAKAWSFSFARQAASPAHKTTQTSGDRRAARIGGRRYFMNRRQFGILTGAAIATGLAPIVSRAESSPPRSIALLFDSMIAPYWVQSLAVMRAEAARRGWKALEAVSDMDDNRQFQQVKSMIQRKVDGIVIIQTDQKAVIPAIRAANAAKVAMVHYDRAPAESDAYSVAMVSDSRKLMRQAIDAALDAGKAAGGKRKGAILIGSLGDQNAVERLAGFHDAVAARPDDIEVVAEIPTDWKVEKHFSGLTNALQSHPDIDFVTICSDTFVPTVEQVLRTAGRWKKNNEPGHVFIASFDGDENGYKAVADGYVDAVGVQDMTRDIEITFGALESQWKGEKPAKLLYDDKVYVLTPANATQLRDRIWGYQVLAAKQGKN